MKKSTKIIILSIALCIISALGVFCVFAVQNFSLRSGGEIEFIAPGVNVTISEATLTGVSKKTGSGTMSSFSITSSMTEAQIEELSGYKSWSGIKLLFDEEADGSATISFTITNNSSKQVENIMVELSTNTTNESPIQATPSADFCIVPGANHTFTINLNVQDTEKSSKISDFKLTVELGIIKPSDVLSVTDYTSEGFTISTNNNTKTASISKYTGAENSVELPAVVKNANDNLFTVTELVDASSANNSAFRSKKSTLSSIIFPTTLTKIGNFAFHECTALTDDLVIPDGVTAIGRFAFYKCTGFSGNLIIGNGVTTIGDFAFSNCSGFKGCLTIGNSVTTIGMQAFLYCRGFTGDLIIPNSTTTIVEGAFSGCTGFNGDLSIGNSLTSITRSAFPGGTGFVGDLKIGSSLNAIDISGLACRSFNTIIVNPENETFYSKNNCLISKQDKVLVLGCQNSLIPQDENILTIGDSAFSGCTGLTGDLIIPDSVTAIGNSAFSDCSGFKGTLTIGNNVTIIGEKAFSNCRLTGNLIIPNSVITIGYHAFYHCSGFTGDLIIPDSVITIGGAAFYWCWGLSGDLIIGNNVETIEFQAFYGCDALTGDLIIGESVTTIGGNKVFMGCSGISSITIKAITPPTLGSNDGFNDTNDCPIYVPAESVEAYKTATNWTEYASRIVAIGS